jgi:hypothetical protein
VCPVCRKPFTIIVTNDGNEIKVDDNFNTHKRGYIPVGPDILGFHRFCIANPIVSGIPSRIFDPPEVVSYEENVNDLREVERGCINGCGIRQYSRGLCIPCLRTENEYIRRRSHYERRQPSLEIFDEVAYVSEDDISRIVLPSHVNGSGLMNTQHSNRDDENPYATTRRMGKTTTVSTFLAAMIMNLPKPALVEKYEIPETVNKKESTKVKRKIMNISDKNSKRREKRKMGKNPKINKRFSRRNVKKRGFKHKFR